MQDTYLCVIYCLGFLLIRQGDPKVFQEVYLSGILCSLDTILDMQPTVSKAATRLMEYLPTSIIVAVF